MKLFKTFALCVTISLLTASAALSQTNTPPPDTRAFSTVITDFFNPTNSFLQAKEINVLAFGAYHRDECIGAGLGMKFWISDQQGASLNYVTYANDTADWELSYGYRRLFGTKLELALLAGGKTDVDNTDNGIVRLFTELDATFKFSAVDLFVAAHFPVDQRPGIRFGVSKSF